MSGGVMKYEMLAIPYTAQFEASAVWQVEGHSCEFIEECPKSGSATKQETTIQTVPPCFVRLGFSQSSAGLRPKKRTLSKDTTFLFVGRTDTAQIRSSWGSKQPRSTPEIQSASEYTP